MSAATAERAATEPVAATGSESLTEPAARTDWGARTEPLSPEELAAMIGRTQDRCAGLLFTATATEDLDGLGVWARLQDLATAGLWRQITQTAARAGGRYREFLGDEIALSTRLTPVRGASEAEMALDACSLPGLVEAVEDGTLTHWHARRVVYALNDVPALALEQRQAVVLILLARYHGQDSNRLGKDTARLIASIDPIAAAGRKQAADARRQVQTWPAADGQGVFQLRGGAEHIARVMAAIRAKADQPVDPGDERTRDQRLFDAAVDLLTGGPGAGGWHVDLIVPVSVATGGDLELADLPGFGPVLPSTARDLLPLADTVARVTVDVDGHVITADAPQPLFSPTSASATPRATAARAKPAEPVDPVDPVNPVDALSPVVAAILALATAPVVVSPLGGAGYVVSRRLRRYLEARDRTCTFPGCPRPAAYTDKDHAIPWPQGPTDPANLGCLCRHHHRAKQVSFTVQRLPDGMVRWITRGGQQYDRPPVGF